MLDNRLINTSFVAFCASLSILGAVTFGHVTFTYLR
jgi:hypothetical protein